MTLRYTARERRVSLAGLMRVYWMLLVAMILPVSNVLGVAQTAAPAGQAAAVVPATPLPTEPAAIFAAAAPFYHFSSSKLKPWYFKASYQLYDKKGNATTQGSYEYWWASPDTYRSKWTRQGLESSDWHVGEKRFHADTGLSLEFFERKLESALLTPLPEAQDLDLEKVRFEKHETKFGAVKLPCVMVVRKMPFQHGQLQVVPMGLFPTFCFEPEHPVLRAYYAYGATEVVYNRVVRVQGMYLPLDVTILDGANKVLTATVDKVEGITSTSSAFTPSKEVLAVGSLSKVEISSGVAAGNLLTKVSAHYPQDAKDARVQGKVVLRATIGTDGSIHELSVLEGPSPSLIGASMWAVLQWKYKPYLLKGVPVEVDTTINVVFSLGG